ncbi:MAG: response regulator [Desulfobacterales bacterium]|nr:response regulator [Desulfobacterales bacterium]
MNAYNSSKMMTPDDQTESMSENQETVYDDQSESRDTIIDDLTDTPVKNPVKSILFVDDEEPVRRLFKEALEKFGYQVRLATNGNEAIALFRAEPADLMITDIFMPEKDGHTLILEVKQDFPNVHIFAITGKKFFDPQMELDIAKTLGAIKVFTKPCKLSQLLAAIKELSV